MISRVCVPPFFLQFCRSRDSHVYYNCLRQGVSPVVANLVVDEKVYSISWMKQCGAGRCPGSTFTQTYRRPTWSVSGRCCAWTALPMSSLLALSPSTIGYLGPLRWCVFRLPPSFSFPADCRLPPVRCCFRRVVHDGQVLSKWSVPQVPPLRRYRCTTAFLHYCTVLLLHFCITALLSCCTVALAS